jgi:tetratricopeptide (TPR) repeat protein
LRGVANADRGGDLWQMMTARANHANALHFAGQRAKAEALFADAERRQTEMNPEYPLLYSQRGYHYCDLWIAKREWQAALGRARKVLEWPQITLLDRGLVRLSLGRAQLAWALAKIGGSAAAQCARDDVRTAAARLNESIDVLRQSGNSHYIPAGLRARAALRRSLGDWTGAVSDLDEVEEIAEPGPMRLFLCDIALERARLAFGTADAFAPLHGFLDDAPPKPERPSEAERSRMHGEAAKQLAIAAKYIETCGYHRRDEELAELQAVLRGEVSFASLPPRV